MSVKVTKKQKLILDFISAFCENHGSSPSYREIMNGVGLSSVSAVAEHIDNLVKKGALKKTSGTARSLEVVDLSFPETTELFQRTLIICTESESEILHKAAQILGIEL